MRSTAAHRRRPDQDSAALPRQVGQCRVAGVWTPGYPEDAPYRYVQRMTSLNPDSQDA